MGEPSRSGAPATGFNHNVRYGGRVFHVQTEDSGPAQLHIFTHVYMGGNILASSRSSYAEAIAGLPPHEVQAAVRARMEEQHKAMVRELLGGRHDAEIARRGGGNVYEPGVLAGEGVPKQEDVRPSPRPSPAKSAGEGEGAEGASSAHSLPRALSGEGRGGGRPPLRPPTPAPRPPAVPLPATPRPLAPLPSLPTPPPAAPAPRPATPTPRPAPGLDEIILAWLADGAPRW